MRILYHHRTASGDGQAVHIEEMIAALRSVGHDVLVVGPATARAGMGTDVAWVTRLKGALPRALYELLELGYSVVEFRRIARASRAFRPDVVYVRYNLFAMAGLISKRMLRLPLLLEVNSPLAEERARFGGLALRRLAAWAERSVWRGADHVLPVTEVLGRIVVNRGVEPQRVTVIPNGVNEAHFGRAPARSIAKARLGLEHSIVLGFAGFVRDWHGVDRIVRWMAEPATPASVHLLIVGDGPERGRLEALAHSVGLASRVTFTGFVSREEVPALAAAFDVALQPAVVAYASPLKMLEYMALGKAIVAPRQPNVEELVVDGASALLFDPDDPAALRVALDRLVADGALREALGAEAARTIARRGLTWIENARRVTALVAEIPSHSPGREALPWRGAS